ncbi:stage II sporulation protein E [Defluviitalea phaphyphila]|uniref:stage II sporulation protein E n=1 Tax=Defluviitalea phaphyphila TaxID=1473580 RepID=UPI000730777D|nr:stage II sporulation protein E [Defluviitalea phaphyphila]
MERIEYRTLKKSDMLKFKKTTGLKQIFLELSYKDLLIDIIGFMTARVVLFTNLLPLSVAYFGAASYIKVNRIWLFLFITAGVLSIRNFVSPIKYISIFILISIILHFIESKGYKKTTIGQAIISMISSFCISMFIAGINGFAGYYIIVAILESILIFGVTYIYKDAISSIKGNFKRTTLSIEEIISLILLFGAATAGIMDFSIYGIYFREVISIFIVLLFGFIGGPAIGGTIGIIIGSILTLIGVNSATSIGIFGISGIMVGLFKDIGRIGSGIGFLLSHVVINLYLEGSIITYDFFKTFMGALVILIILPKSAILFFKQFISSEPKIEQEIYYKRIRDITAQQLEKFSNSFLKLSKTLTNLSEKKTSLNKKDVSMLIEDVASKVCSDCGLCSHCWEIDFYNTYQTVFSILSAAEKKPRIDLNDIPKDFLGKCLKVEEFVDTTNRIFELYKLNLIWHNRIIESRELVCEQLRGVSSIIGNLATEVYGQVYFKEDLEEIIRIELDKEKIPVCDVIVIQNKQKKYEVTIIHNSCKGNRICSRNILPIVNRVLGVKMKIVNTRCSAVVNKDKCKLKLIEEEKYRVVTAIAREAKDYSNISGDSYSSIELKDGQFLLALSDGMGTGIKASEESSASIELLEEFMESGFDKDTAIKMINSVLVLKSNEESFSTLDMTIIDMYTGIAEFIKIGAACTFLKREDMVEIIGSSSLPVGLLNNVDLDITKRKLKDGDIIIMVTDGIIDSKKDIVEKEKWFKNIIKGIETIQPQYIADYILNTAKENEGQEISDDMTVLVCRIWEKY